MSEGSAGLVIPPAPPVHAQVPPLPIYLFKFIRNSISALSDAAFEAPTLRKRIFGVDHLLISDPDGARHVMIEARERYRRPYSSIRAIRPLTGAGLLLADGDAWRRQRRSLAPSFTPPRVGELLPHFHAAAQGLVQSLEGRASVNLSAAFHDSTLEAVLRALFSIEPGDGHRELAAMVRRYMDGVGKPNFLDGQARSEDDFQFAGRSRRAFQKEWFAAVDRLVAERRADPAAERKRDLLNLLLAARDPNTGEPLSDEEVRDQSATMLFAGFETTSRLLFWASYLLCLAPDEQRRLREEVRQAPPEGAAQMDDLAKWPRLRQVLLETLRLYPPVAYLVRDAIEPDVVMGETVAPGARVWISPWVIHRHRKFWDHPLAFMPERFEGQTSPWTNGPFMPFGVGPRLCIGAAFAMAEAEIMLATLISRYEFALTDTRPVLPVANVTMRPSREPNFTLTPL